MTQPEPRLTTEDHRIWGTWMRTALLHSRSTAHRRAVDKARGILAEGLSRAPDSPIMWSGGKDSTALVALAASLGGTVEALSEKDDLDYPGEVDYVAGLASRLDVDLRIIVPSVSPAEWFAEHAHELGASDDVHGRAAGLSKACFYGVVEAATRDRGGIVLGLRQEESHGRRMNAATKGAAYRRADGQWTINPLTYWSGLDVYAYLAARDIEPLHVYRCVAFAHAREPWRIRKSWWVPGAHARHGGTAWLRRYYPSLYARLVAWMPAARLYA